MEKLDDISNQEEHEYLIENISDEELQKVLDKYYTPYEDVYKRLA